MKKVKKEKAEDKIHDVVVENENNNEMSQDNADETTNDSTENMADTMTDTPCIDEKTELMYKIAELNDKFLRLHSEFDNYRKRTIKEKNELAKYANAELITTLLPVIDDFERALKLTQLTPETESLIQGIELIFNKLVKLLEQQGLKPINSVGEPFNTDYHEAITKVQVEEEDMKGKVFDEVQKGYALNEKVIRYAKVVVAE